MILLISNPIYANKDAIENNFTKVKIFSPWGYPGYEVNDGLTIIHEDKGSCWSGSLANLRPDAWRCGSKNRIYDPCFSKKYITKIGDKLVCIQSPWDRKAVLMTLTEPLKNEQAHSKDYLKHDPWAIELFNGIRCVYGNTGTIPVIAGIPTSSTCFNQSNQIVGITAFNLFDRNSPIWLVFIQSENNQLFLEQVPIKEVWY